MCPPAEHHPELPLKVVMPELPTGSCRGESSSLLCQSLPWRGQTCWWMPVWGDTEEHPSFWGAEGASPRLAGLPLPCACLKMRFAGGYKTAALPGVCYRRSPTGKRGLIQHRRSHSRHPFEEPLPRGLAGASKVFCLAEPLMLELYHRLLERLVHHHPASPMPWAPKGFAPGSEDETAATTGSSQWRCQMWRGSIRTSPWKPPWDIHPNPGHPS